MLKNVSTEKLEAELKRRKEAKQLAVPEQLPSPDFAPLQKICQDYINDLAEGGYGDDDYRQYIYETAMECIFGKDVWRWKRSVES